MSKQYKDYLNDTEISLEYFRDFDFFIKTVFEKASKDHNVSNPDHVFGLLYTSIVLRLMDNLGKHPSIINNDIKKHQLLKECKRMLLKGADGK